MKKLYLLLVLALACIIPCGAMLYPVSFEEKFMHATLVAEGKVTSQYSFWNDAHTMTYTASTILLSKVFSGVVKDSTIEVLTLGGVVDNDGVHASDVLALQPGEQGVFFLYPNSFGLKAPGSGALLFDVYSSSQGAIKYDAIGKSASAPFVRYAQISDLYAVLTNRAGHAFTILRKTAPAAASGHKATGSITSLSPSTVRAGAFYDTANNLLTITGTGFGAPGGSAAILFDNPDDGAGGSYTSIAYSDAAYIVSWNAAGTQIMVRVPEKAGSGTLFVIDNTGATAASATLTVQYSCIGTVFGTTPYESNLMAVNGFGGYTVVYGTSTAGGGRNIVGVAEQETFRRAMATHRDLIGFNLKDSTGTTRQTVNPGDSVNIIQFDNTNTGTAVLPAGVLAICYSDFIRCSAPANAGVQQRGFDITIRNNGVSSGTTGFVVNFCAPYPDSAAYIDLETVLLHELGHAENQDHIIEPSTGTSYPQINPAAVMHYATSNAVKRTSPDLPLLLCGRYEVTPQGNPYGSCTGIPNIEMTPSATTISARDECSSVTTLNTISGSTPVAFDLIHATSNRSTDPQATALNTAGTTTSITNTQYYGFRTDANGGSLNIVVSGYTPSPANADTCHAAGVQLALYATTGTCPAGGSYPAPAQSWTFNANGALSSVTLPASTSYLLVADGVENTKSAFNLSFSGTALPLSILRFDGAAERDANILHWVVNATEREQLQLERGSNGRSFVQVAIFDIPGAGMSEQSYRDAEAGTGDNFYRLKVVSANGVVAYSNVVKISRAGGIAAEISVAPNPATGAAVLRYNAAIDGAVSVSIRTATGISVFQQTYQSAIGANAWMLPVDKLSSGCYSIWVRNEATGQHVIIKLLRQ